MSISAIFFSSYVGVLSPGLHLSTPVHSLIRVRVAASSILSIARDGPTFPELDSQHVPLSAPFSGSLPLDLSITKTFPRPLVVVGTLSSEPNPPLVLSISLVFVLGPVLSYIGLETGIDDWQQTMSLEIDTLG